jgi:hypothetical protein
MKNTVFLDDQSRVVQVIVGELTEQQQAQFLADYAILFGATQTVAVDGDTAVWIGGSYTDGTFTEPPAPEPLPEPLPEVVTEPEI